MDEFLRSIRLRVFSKEEDDYGKLKAVLVSFFPFNLDEEEIKLCESAAEGFQARKIRIVEVCLAKQRHIRKFMESLLNRLTKEQKELLIAQKESRLDEELNFFIRFDKEKLIQSDAYFITDCGNCFHLTLSVAAFPAKREVALAIIDKIFK